METNDAEVEKLQEEVEVLKRELIRSRNEFYSRLKSEHQFIDAMLTCISLDGEAVSVEDVRLCSEHFKTMSCIYDNLEVYSGSSGGGLSTRIGVHRLLQSLLPSFCARTRQQLRLQFTGEDLQLSEKCAKSLGLSIIALLASPKRLDPIDLRVSVAVQSERIHISLEGLADDPELEDADSFRRSLINSAMHYDLEGTLTYMERLDETMQAIISFPANMRNLALF